MNLVYRYRRMVGRGMEQWDTDSGKTHAGEDGYTLCGHRIGNIREGWEVSQYHFSAESVDCRHCIRKINRSER